jgi:(1->4)-alpha-D-glucan 1-alpha-D-glucosylmutase
MAVPRATYRVQLHAGFTFGHAAGIAEYLSVLGVSHLYTSPCLQAAPGSTHGYDVVDVHSANDELGGEKGFNDLQDALHEHDLGQIIDIVPNHMAALCPQNGWWEDLLRQGPSSRYASFFDVYWKKGKGPKEAQILLPLLGDHYGVELRRGRIALARREGKLRVTYFEHSLPLAWTSLVEPLQRAAAEAGIGPPPPALKKKSSGTAVQGQAPEMQGAPRADRGAWEADIRDWFREALKVEAFAREIDEWLDVLNADAGRLDRFLGKQYYRLVYWRTSESSPGYRRFFDINDLVALRMEEEEVFEQTHRLLLEWFQDNLVDGFRVDHPDGLRDPSTYFNRLREAAPGAWIVAEKILVSGERLRPRWPVQGTTGYDFLNQLNALFVCPEGEKPLTDFYREFTGEGRDFNEILHESKRFIIEKVLGGDLNRLVETLGPVCSRHCLSRDFTPHQLVEALTELLALFPVYRTYIGSVAGYIDEEDRRIILEAAVGAKKSSDPDVVDYLVSLLLRKVEDSEGVEFAMRFQQLSGPVMAKGGEDTALYRYFRLISLNEVGGDPDRFGIPVEIFHRLMEERSRELPDSMLSTSTHDTKRSEDVRARVNLLPEIPDRWRDAVLRWSSMNESRRRGGVPDRNVEYLLYQTLVGTWPIERDRIISYMGKAVREAKIHTSWTKPDEGYEKALAGFVASLFEDPLFLEDLQGFVAPLINPGRVNSLSQTLVKLTAPGVPDMYQGTELWDLSLVDPDNRRPVDFHRRMAMLRELEASTASSLTGKPLPLPDRGSLGRIMARVGDGLPKLWLIRQTLSLRKHHPEYFARGASYEPLTVTGSRARHGFCFARNGRVVIFVPRFPLLLGGDWQDTSVRIPGGTWINLLGGQELNGGVLPVSSLLESFPVALLFLH